MGETGKRYRPQRDYDRDNKNQKRRTNEKDENSGDEMVVYRILCPDGVIGSVIGKSGKVINSIRQETRAKVKVVDPFPGAKDRVITIYSYVKDKEDIEVDDEDFDREPVCAAQGALLKMHTVISKSLASSGDSEKRRKDKDECHLLVPSSQAANIIGKAGATIKKLRVKTRTNIKVTAKDATDTTHSCAMEFDNFVVITGESDAVKRALFAVSTIMYKFSPKEEIPVDTSVPEAPPSIFIPSDVPIYQPSGFYHGSDPIVSSRSVAPVIGTSHVPELHGYGDSRSTWPLYSPALPVVSGYAGASRSEELIIRVLCAFDKIGRVIGKGGSTIKSMRQASGARVEVDDTKKDRNECIVTVIGTESPDDLKSMAVEAVLLLQSKINDDDDETITIRLLVPSKVIGCIIGKGGVIINEIRKKTRADVRISKGEKPRCADSSDELVEVVGEVGSVRDALVQIVLRLRDDVLKDRDNGRNHSIGVDSMFSGSSALAVPSVLPSVPQVAQMSFDQMSDPGSGLGLLSSSSLYGYGSVPMAENVYGSMSAYSSKHYGGMPPPTNDMVIPANAVGKVLGKGGANIANIQKISGAAIEISESKSSRGERVAHISGSHDQRRAAENMIQAFILAT